MCRFIFHQYGKQIGNGITVLITAIMIIKESKDRCSNIHISANELCKVLQQQVDIYQWSQNWKIGGGQIVSSVSELSSNWTHPSCVEQNCCFSFGHGIQVTQLSLYHRGMEKSKWLMKLINQAGFSPWVLFCTLLFSSICSFSSFPFLNLCISVFVFYFCL